MSRKDRNMEVCMVSVEACMWPNSCSVIMLSFMLYFSCAYDGIYIGNERWMNLMEYGNIDVGCVV